MSKLTVLLIFVALVLTGRAAAAGPASAGSGNSSELQMDVTIRKTVQEVRLGFQLSDGRGQPVSGMQPGKFSVFQDGQRVTNLTGFYVDHDLPLRLLLMIDASDSMSKGFAAEREAAAGFLERIVRPGVDQSAVLVFAGHLEMNLGDQESGREKLQRIGVSRSGGLTALYDVICQVGEALPAHDPDHPLARRVLVLLSDGNDTYSMHSLNDAIAAAQKAELVVYAVAAHKPSEYQPGDANLRRLAEATGGRVIFLKKYEQAGQAFGEIEQEIRAQYTVTFRAIGDTCGFHRLQIEPEDRSFKVRARAGFYGDCKER